MKVGVGIAPPSLGAARRGDHAGAVVLRVSRQGCVGIFAQWLRFAVYPKAVGHTAQLLGSLGVVGHCDRGTGAGRQAAEHFALDVGREAQLPRFQDQVAAGAVFVEVALRPVPHKRNEQAIFVEDVQPIGGVLLWTRFLRQGFD